ncbi:amino acid deaminase [Halomonas urumqiensis]|uniref:Amino acid deaminase n=1 Tax=Halomonas urumqiensis TaxID=1684789 RepID=A0A2N7UHC5_9GAMM|nr:amino acid deaminase [Halomonas urumqiensis]PMR79813.1 amino acid deaminase [Halomonas urumqiensis]PTB02159.1 amino acid deaminase [Halomonas urumqiensis]GHE21616.1 amino acid deaminase [Halomonas urumqiensis]
MCADRPVSAAPGSGHRDGGRAGTGPFEKEQFDKGHFNKGLVDKGLVDKGLPEIGNSLLDGVSLPAAVVFEAPLAHNLAWMQRFANDHGAKLAPHGKTTMTPALFRRQLDAGAWGITLATAAQCRAACVHGGVSRLLLANQLVGEANMAIIADLLEAGADITCVVDSLANVSELGRYFGARELRLKVLIELGVPGGRCGCRDHDQVMALGEAIDAEPALVLSGIEGYEGVGLGDNPEASVRGYAWQLVEVAQALDHDRLIEAQHPLITASGSAWYDLIAGVFREAHLGAHFVPVLRPGCYVVHDHGLYRDAQRDIRRRRPELANGLLPALEVFAQVQSLPEPGLAIVAMGRRDAGGDRLPEPLRRYREGGCASRPLSVEGWEVVKLMDQHAFVRLPRSDHLDEARAESSEGARDVRVGDIVAFGVSHPCLTFDKWRQVLLANAELDVVDVMPTWF